jgi:hypothetical protein
MKKKLSENVETFAHGAVFSVLVSTMSNLLSAIIDCAVILPDWTMQLLQSEHLW